MWMSMIADGHDICCSCVTPFAHLLDSIFPEGHTDRNKTIEEIITRDFQLCHSGGIEETSHGMAGGDTEDIKREECQEEEDIERNIDTLLAAAAADAEKDTR